jgi:hypothetical protein
MASSEAGTEAAGAAGGCAAVAAGKVAAGLAAGHVGRRRRRRWSCRRCSGEALNVIHRPRVECLFSLTLLQGGLRDHKGGVRRKKGGGQGQGRSEPTPRVQNGAFRQCPAVCSECTYYTRRILLSSLAWPRRPRPSTAWLWCSGTPFPPAAAPCLFPRVQPCTVSLTVCS